MRYIVLVSVLLMSWFSTLAGEKILQSYKYNSFNVYDRDFNVVQQTPYANGNPIGLFMLIEVDGIKFISITAGDKPVYEFQVSLTKEEIIEGVRTEIYGGGMNFKGQIIPLQVFVSFSGNGLINSVLVDVFNSTNYIELDRLVKF